MLPGFLNAISRSCTPSVNWGMLALDRGHGAEDHCTDEPFIEVVWNVPSGMTSVMATLPWANSAQQPSVRLVEPGFGSVTLSVLASVRR